MYLNLIQVAASFGVSERVVEGWIRDEGLPHTPDRGRLLFDRAQVVSWAAARGLAAQAGFLAPERGRFATGLRIEPMLRTGGIWRDVAERDIAGIFGRIGGSLPDATPEIRRMLALRLASAGGVTLAPIGGGFALPHPSARIALGRQSGVVAILMLRDAMTGAEPAVDDVPVTRLVFFVAPSPRAHLDLLGRLSRLFVKGPVRDLVSRGAADEEIFQGGAAADAAAPGTAAGAGAFS
jgi:PTS system nitrogen regulatory IIA component